MKEVTREQFLAERVARASHWKSQKRNGNKEKPGHDDRNTRGGGNGRKNGGHLKNKKAK